MNRFDLRLLDRAFYDIFFFLLQKHWIIPRHELCIRFWRDTEQKHEDSENEDEEDSEEIETKMKLKPKKKKAKPKIKNVKKPDIPLDMNYVKRYVKRPLFRADDAYVRMSGDT